MRRLQRESRELLVGDLGVPGSSYLDPHRVLLSVEQVEDTTAAGHLDLPAVKRTTAVLPGRELAAELTMPGRLGRSRLLAHQVPGPAGVTRGLRAQVLPPRRRLSGSEADVPFIVNRRWCGSVPAFRAHRGSGSGTSPKSASSCGTVSVLSRSSSA